MVGLMRMTRLTRHFSVFVAGVAALALAGCADLSSAWQKEFGAKPPPTPKTVVVTDFVMSSDLLVLDRGYTARLERKSGGLMTQDRKPRTIARVNDEIVASVIATLREAGLEARPGTEESLTLSDNALVVDGRLHPGEPGSVGKKPIGFAVGHDGVVADMTLSLFSSRGKQSLLSFSADAKGAGKPPTGKLAAARNADIAAALKDEDSGQEKLSPDVETQARRIGRAVGDRIVAYAKEKGWLGKAEAGESGPVALPKPKPEQKPDKKKPAAA
jgi:hypothetical protein